MIELEKTSIAAGLGLEPRYSPPEGDVLPLDDPAIYYTFKYFATAIILETTARTIAVPN